MSPRAAKASQGRTNCGNSGAGVVVAELDVVLVVLDVTGLVVEEPGEAEVVVTVDELAVEDVVVEVAKSCAYITLLVSPDRALPNCPAAPEPLLPPMQMK